ncbi:MAG: hypothetical protein HY675_02575 [Chloroflexi bacterium]|nr:hypothetical protein [Chloroflexota bacterium]
MPNVTVVDQPLGGRGNRAGDHVAELLARTADRFDTVRIAVAFAKASGVGILFDHLRAFPSPDRTLDVTVGVNHRGTSRQGLELLLKTGASVNIFNNPGGGTFHPKLYLFERTNTEGVALVGSNNLTRGGLYENYELSVRLDYDLTVAEDATAFDHACGVYDKYINEGSGTVRRLDPALLLELDQQGYLLDETAPTHVGPGDTPPSSGATTALFRRVPVPRGPRVSSSVPSVATVDQPGKVLATFAMTLGPRDTRQQTGYSRDIFIPLAARDANPDFWGWPEAFQAAPGTRGHYRERRIDLRATPAQGPSVHLQQVRLYGYAERSEFRLNCGSLVQSASPGDIFVIILVPAGSGYEYEAMIIPQGRPMHRAFLGTCTNLRPSGKRWGYS